MTNSQMYRDWWALRSGDLRPEQASTLDFSPQFCEKLKSDSLLFETREQADEARAKALSFLTPSGSHTPHEST